MTASKPPKTPRKPAPRPPAPTPIPAGEDGEGTPLLKPLAPSSGSSGAKKG